MVDVYIAGSIIHSNSKEWGFFERIENVVKDMGLKAFTPHVYYMGIGKTNPYSDDLDPVEIFTKDIDFVKNAKLIIAEVSNPSLGVGIEIGTAIHLNKKIICLARNNVKLSRMITGPVNLGLIELIRYENEEDALSQLKFILEAKFKHL